MGTPSHNIGQLTFLPPMADALLYQHDILATAKVDHAQPGVRLVMHPCKLGFTPACNTAEHCTALVLLTRGSVHVSMLTLRQHQDSNPQKTGDSCILPRCSCISEL